ncbi:MAG TPA: cupin domain-containing protein [bacterium]|nr:cupin domain-containing protein [bacterium]
MSTGTPIGDEDLVRGVQGEAGILTVRAGPGRRTWNGIHYLAGLSAKNVGASQLSMNVATIPPGGTASAHIHVGFEVMLYILQGRVRHEYGPGCRRVIDNEAGDFIFIAPGVPHEVVNLSDTDPVVAVVARADASEWEHIIRYDRAQGRPATD